MSHFGPEHHGSQAPPSPAEHPPLETLHTEHEDHGLHSALHSRIIDPAHATVAASTEHLGASQVASQTEVGDPSAYAHDWFYQEHNGYCVPSSITQVIESQTGITLHSYNLVEHEASHLGLPGTDMSLPEAQTLLHSFDIPSHVVQGGDDQQAVTQLAEYLHDGRSIILAVNPDPFWYGTQTSSENPQGQADHAVVVTGINTETGMVTLSDPGTQSGNEEQVPLSTFVEAWSASDYQMLVTDDGAGGADHAAAAAVVNNLDGSHGSTTESVPITPAVLLPIALGLGLAAAVKSRGAAPRVPKPATIRPALP